MEEMGRELCSGGAGDRQIDETRVNYNVQYPMVNGQLPMLRHGAAIED